MIVYAVALLLQLTFFTEVRVADVAPELPALIAILAGLFAGAQNGSVMAFIAGLVWDVYLPTPIGLAAVTFAVVAYALGDFTEDLFHDTQTRTLIAVFVGTAAMVSAYALLGAVLGQGGLVTGRLLIIVLVASLFNTMLSLPAAAAMRWALGIRRASALDSGIRNSVSTRSSSPSRTRRRKRSSRGAGSATGGSGITNISGRGFGQ